MANSWGANNSLICKHHSLTSGYGACLALASACMCSRHEGLRLYSRPSVRAGPKALGKIANSQPPLLAEQANRVASEKVLCYPKALGASARVSSEPLRASNAARLCGGAAARFPGGAKHRVRNKPLRPAIADPRPNASHCASGHFVPSSSRAFDLWSPVGDRDPSWYSYSSVFEVAPVQVYDWA